MMTTFVGTWQQSMNTTWDNESSLEVWTRIVTWSQLCFKKIVSSVQAAQEEQSSEQAMKDLHSGGRGSKDV